MTEKTYGIEISFLGWMRLGLPVVFVMLPLAGLILTRIAFPLREFDQTSIHRTVDNELAQLGDFNSREKSILTLFVVTVLGWIFCKPISNATGLPLTEATIAIIAAILLFTVPLSLRMNEFMLEWRVVKDLPLGILLIFGGGLALADAVSTSGLAQTIGESLSSLITVGIWLTVLIVIIAIILLTEFTLNTASAATFIPIFGAVSIGLGQEAYVLALPAALGASMAFMLPVATPPNTIVYSYDPLTTKDMIKAGLWLNLAAIGVCFLAVFFVLDFVVG